MASAPSLAILIPNLMVRALLKNYHQKRIAFLQLHNLGRQMFVQVFTERELQPEEF
jgi:hypothetical protein